MEEITDMYPLFHCDTAVSRPEDDEKHATCLFSEKLRDPMARLGRSRDTYVAAPRRRLPFWRKPTGYELFVSDIERFDGVSFYDLNDDDKKLAEYMLDKGFMWYDMKKGKPILYITELGRETMEEEW